MSEIHPFRAITPIIYGMEYKIHDHFLHVQNNCDVNTKCYEQKIIYINNLLKQNLLHLHSSENFYCCRISSSTFSVVGLIALVEVDAIDKTIFRHERCVNLKKDRYLDYFKKYKTQITPIILMHEANEQINVTLNKIVTQKNALFSVKDYEYQYDLWKVDNTSYYKKLYNPIRQFLVADGHHRLSSVRTLSTNGFVTALMISSNNIKSSNIQREYLDVSSSSKKMLLSFLDTNFGIQKITNNDLHDKICLRIEGNIYQIINSDDAFARQEILEFFDNHINYKNQKLNFYNSLYNDQNKGLFTNDTDISMFIPAFQITNEIKNSPIYPPHSTLFYPKLPEGLVSFCFEIE